MFLVVWLAVNYLVCRIALIFEGYHSMAVFLDSFTRTFGISPRTVAVLADITFGHLLLGSAACLAWNGVLERRNRANPSLKMTCAGCGGHIEFSVRNLGQKIPCPHCQTSVTLRQPDANLKMFCFFCKGHIEYPPHALGQKLKCPHCQMDITLKESA